MQAIFIYVAAAVLEIGGCFAFWAWMRLDKSPLWLVPGGLALALFALLLTLSPAAFAGRSFAAYGGVYIAASLLWMWLVEGQRPISSDMAGAVICVCGALVILFGARAA